MAYEVRSRPGVGARLLLLAGLLTLGGCEPVSLTLFGVGAASGVGYTMNGVAYKTFTAPIDEVETATVVALDRMGIPVQETETGEQGERVKKSSIADRNVEVVLEPISPKATRVRSIVRNDSLFMDSATATEILIQTERALVDA